MRPWWYFTILEKLGGTPARRESHSWSTEGRQIPLHANFCLITRISFSFFAFPLSLTCLVLSFSPSIPPPSFSLSLPLAIVPVTYHSIGYNVTTKNANDITDITDFIVICYFLIKRNCSSLASSLVAEFFSATEVAETRFERQWNSPFATRYPKLRKPCGAGCIQERWVIVFSLFFL